MWHVFLLFSYCSLTKTILWTTLSSWAYTWQFMNLLMNMLLKQGAIKIIIEMENGVIFRFNDWTHLHAAYFWKSFVLTLFCLDNKVLLYIVIISIYHIYSFYNFIIQSFIENHHILHSSCIWLQMRKEALISWLP